MANTKSRTNRPLTRALRPVKGRGKVVTHLVLVNGTLVGYVHKRDRSAEWYAVRLDGSRVLAGHYENTPQAAASIGLAVGFNKEK